MSIVDKIYTVVVSRDTRLLNILLNKESANGDAVITVESNVSDFTEESDVYIYDLDMIGDDSKSLDEAIADLKNLPINKPLILIGSREVVSAVANDASLTDKVSRTMNKPLSYRQLILAIKACSENDIASSTNPSKQFTSLRPNNSRFVVLSLSVAALLITAITFFQTEKSPLPNLPEEIVKPLSSSNPYNETEIDSYTLEIQKLNELAKLAFSEGRLISPEKNSVFSHLKQIEEYDSYNVDAHQIRSRLLIDLKASYEQKVQVQDITNMNRILSKIVELEPYNQNYVDLLSSLENNKNGSIDLEKEQVIDSLANTEASPEVESQNLKWELESVASIEETVLEEPQSSEPQLPSIANIEEEVELTHQLQEKEIESLEGVDETFQPNQENSESQISDTSLASIEPLPDRIEPAKVLKKVEPTYPRLAVDLSYEGWVELDYQVDEKGNAVNIKTSKGERMKTFEQAAIKAIKKWKFEPSTNLNTGSTVLSEPMTTTFHFSLD